VITSERDTTACVARHDAPLIGERAAHRRTRLRSATEGVPADVGSHARLRSSVHHVLTL